MTIEQWARDRAQFGPTRGGDDQPEPDERPTSTPYCPSFRDEREASNMIEFDDYHFYPGSSFQPDGEDH